MCGVFSDRSDAVVTRATCANYLCMVDCENRRKNITRVTVFAHIHGLNMGRILACCISSIVTTKAIASDVHVVKIRRQPGHGRMAIITIVAARYVCRIFPGRRKAIVTRTT